MMEVIVIMLVFVGFLWLTVLAAANYTKRRAEETKRAKAQLVELQRNGWK